MDDCNFFVAQEVRAGNLVQIPLWTIVTVTTKTCFPKVYPVQIPLWTIVTLLTQLHHQVAEVQIPLWTIVTDPAYSNRAMQSCSDSSMDDCNRPDYRGAMRPSPFRFLYGRL